MLIAAGILFIALVLAAASLTKRSLRELSQDEKVKLVDAAAGTPVSWFLVMVAIFVSWGWVVFKRPELTTQATVIVLGAVLVLSAAAGFATYRGYRRIGMPPRFLRSFLVARGLRLAGAALLFAAAARWLFHPHAAG